MFVAWIFLPCVWAAWEFNIVASTESKVPGTTMEFEAFGSLGVAADSAVYFLGYSDYSFTGVFKDTIPPSVLTIVADSINDMLPVGNKSLGTKFDHFQLGSSCSSTQASLVSFVGATYQTGSTGIYISSTKETVATTTSLLPQKNLKIMSVESPSLNDEHQQLVAFVASVLDLDTQAEDDYILLSSPGSEGRQLAVLINHDTVIPNSPNLRYTLLSGSVIVGDNVVFFGSNYIKSANATPACDGHLPNECNSTFSNGPWPGLYLYSLSGSLTKLVDLNDVAPGDTSKYNAFSDPSFDGSSIAYIAAFAGQRGIFVYSLKDQKDYLVANFETTVPGTNILFSAFPHIPSIKGNVVIFYGSTPSPNQKYGGVYQGELLKDPASSISKTEVSKVLNKQDVLAGYNVYLLSSSFDAFNGKNVAFFSSLTKNGKQVEAIIVGTLV